MLDVCSVVGSCKKVQGMPLCERSGQAQVQNFPPGQPGLLLPRGQLDRPGGAAKLTGEGRLGRGLWLLPFVAENCEESCVSANPESPALMPSVTMLPYVTRLMLDYSVATAWLVKTYQTLVAMTADDLLPPCIWLGLDGLIVGKPARWKAWVGKVEEGCLWRPNASPWADRRLWEGGVFGCCTRKWYPYTIHIHAIAAFSI